MNNDREGMTQLWTMVKQLLVNDWVRMTADGGILTKWVTHQVGQEIGGVFVDDSQAPVQWDMSVFISGDPRIYKLGSVSRILHWIPFKPNLASL